MLRFISIDRNIRLNKIANNQMILTYKTTYLIWVDIVHQLHSV